MVLNHFKELPSSNWAKEMTEYDFIYCYVNILLDENESDDYSEKNINENFNLSEYRSKGGVYF